MAKKVLLIEDDGFALHTLAKYVRRTDPDALIDEAQDAETALRMLNERPDYDFVFCDLHLAKSGEQRFDIVEEAARSQEGAVITISADEEPETIRRAMAAGASVYIAKVQGPTVLPVLLQAALLGAKFVPVAAMQPVGNPALFDALSPRDLVILKLVAEGNTYKMVARELGERVSENAVKTALHRIIVDKLKVANRAAALQIYRERVAVGG